MRERIHIKTGRRMLCLILALALVLSGIGVPAGLKKASAAVSAEGLNLPATVTAKKLNVRMKPSIKAKQVKNGDGQVVYLAQGQAVTLLSEAVTDGTKWYQVAFSSNGESLTGYAMALYIRLTMNSTIKGSISNSSGEETTTLYQTTGVSGGTVLSGSKGLNNGQKVTILKELTVGDAKWFKISTKVANVRYRGFVLADHVALLRSEGTKPGIVNGDDVNVRTGAGTNHAVLEYGGKRIQLSKGAEVKILGQKKYKGDRWYHISFQYQGVTLSGFIIGEFVTVSKEEPKKTETPKKTESPEEDDDPEESGTPEKTPRPSSATDAAIQTPVPEDSATDSAIQVATPGAVEADQEFTKLLTGFPSDYQTLLLDLHSKYPSWKFVPYRMGLEWEKAVQNENIVGLNLVSNAKAAEWKSKESGAYDEKTGNYIPFDGDNWVTCSKACLEYYMDPRNFLTADGIFQFENLSYNSANQTIAGVNRILAGTSLASASYTYTDASGAVITKGYAETFIEAASLSGVNPYYLASRVKQEVLGTASGSNAISGTVSGYEGLYNFYNIGASNSTVAGQNVVNGLIFAKNGKDMSASDMEKYMIPWNNQYQAIVGGAKYIGNNYINRGQNTIYLQKFNVTAYSRYSHQYMSNVEAAKAEAQKIYSAYKDMEDTVAVFSIPVYEDMPASPAPIPAAASAATATPAPTATTVPTATPAPTATTAPTTDSKGQDNYLKSLSVLDASTKKELTLSPAFRPEDKETTAYTIKAGASVKKVTVNAEAENKTSAVSKPGTVSLKSGSTVITVSVTSRTGVIRTYVITITK